MIYSEAAYFDGHPCAHVAAWEENRKIQREARRWRAAASEIQRSRSQLS
jgi:hypothetical protein